MTLEASLFIKKIEQGEESSECELLTHSRIGIDLEKRVTQTSAYISRQEGGKDLNTGSIIKAQLNIFGRLYSWFKKSKWECKQIRMSNMYKLFSIMLATHILAGK